MRKLFFALFLLPSVAALGGGLTSRLNINSDVTGLDGSGVLIGMVEPGHPGRNGIEPDILSVPHVNPAGVFVGSSNQQALPGERLSRISPFQGPNHSTNVAEILNGSDVSGALFEGVASGASLFAAAIANGDTPGGAVTLNAMAQRTLTTPAINDRVRAINLSYGVPIQPFVDQLDGNTFITKFLDWSAEEHDVTYVVAWPNSGPGTITSMSDNYNGITVAPSRRAAGANRAADSVMANPNGGFDALGDRTSIDIMAPGQGVPVANLFDNQPVVVNGSSFAAPHVTGAIALLQQHAVQQIDAGNSAFNSRDSRRHQVMKAVLLNSANKLAGVHGTEFDAQDRAGNNWLMSPAFTRSDQPLDQDMGVGMLNVGKALEQYRGGESAPGTVADVGWDHDRSGGVGDAFSYSFNTPSQGGDYIAVTLAWDREVEITDPIGGYNFGDDFFDRDFTDSVNNLNLYLLEADETNINNAVAVSNAADSTVEHIFFEVPAGGGEYKVVVQHESQEELFATSDGSTAAVGIDSRTDFAVAWWAYEPTSILRGDYDGNGLIESEDYDVWLSSYGQRVFSGRGADGNLDGVIDAADYTLWRDAFAAANASTVAAVPEPASALLLLLIAGGRVPHRRA